MKDKFFANILSVDKYAFSKAVFVKELIGMITKHE
jgi:hypothetical protein